VRDAILGLRDSLVERYGRIVRAKTILYHLHRNPVLQRQTVYLPQSSCTIWRVLKEGGRIASRVHDYHPVERPDPCATGNWTLAHWSNRSNSCQWWIAARPFWSRPPQLNTTTALLAVAQLLLICGLPNKLRFDNDPRFVGNWRTDGFP